MTMPPIAVTWAEPQNDNVRGSVQLRCPTCLAGDVKVGWRHGMIVHRLPWPPPEEVWWGGRPKQTYVYRRCVDYDLEGRHVSEAMGFYRFAWKPVRCRNGKHRWLRWVECHADGTYSLGDRAH